MSSPDPHYAPPTTRSWLADAGALFDIGLQGESSSHDPEQVGPYRLLSPLGEGGLGVVWKAEQSHPIRRQVALKLIRPGLHLNREVLARFEQERELLAKMSHPGIAALYDAGTSEDGRPWFAMELLSGEILTSFCNHHQLPLRERVALFILVCDAVHHAHQKGVIHRDLKPSNILVTQVNGRPVPKVIDFGIARLLESDAATVFATRIGEMPSATYPYMSPEQAGSGSSALDTRSDIYTLGVILYELLTGKLPMPEELTRSQDFLRMAQWIREGEPVRPSSRGHAHLRGELDWIVLKAMAREPARRYNSAAALSEDLQRYLEDRAIEARPPGTAYLLGKWIKCHRAAVIASAMVLISLVTALVISITALRSESQQRIRAEQNAHEASQARASAITAQHQETLARKLAEAARDEAEASRDAAEEQRQIATAARSQAESLMNEILFDLRDKAKRIGRLDLLDQVSRNAEAYFAQVPAENESPTQARQRAAMHQNRGAVLAAQGQADEALSHYQKSVGIVQRLADEEPASSQRSADVATAILQLGDACQELHLSEQAQTHYQSILSLLKEGESPDTAATAHERLGDMALEKQELASAQQHFEAGLQLLPAESAYHIAMLEQRMGDVSLRSADTAAASRWLSSSHDRLSALLQHSPDDAELQAAEAVAAGKLARISSAEKASALLARQVTVFEKLNERDGMNLDWRKGLSISHFQAGSFFDDEGPHAKAEHHFLAALETCDDLRQRIAIQLRLSACLLRQDKKSESQQQAQSVIELIQSLPEDKTLKDWLMTAKALAN